MNRIYFILLLITPFYSTTSVSAQNQYGDHWYQNPLGFEPLNLHTSMGALLPAVAVGMCLWLTDKDTTLQHRLSVFGEASPSFGYKYPYTFLLNANVGINYQLRKFMSIGVEMTSIFPSDDFNHTAGIGIRPFARFYLVNTGTWRFYFESGGGLVYTFTQYPKPTDRDDRLGLQLNGITKYGLGAEINFNDRTSLIFGVRHLHISNGNVKGVERNPSHDSNGAFVGLNVRL